MFENIRDSRVILDEYRKSKMQGVTMEIKHVSTKNLHECTAQEVFDFIANHLLTQGKQSFSKLGATCAYRGDGGLSCAAGCLLSDEDYNGIEGGIEGYSWDDVVSRGYSPDAHMGLIMEMQSIHDNTPDPDAWRADLVALAWLRDLEWRFADQ